MKAKLYRNTKNSQIENYMEVKKKKRAHDFMLNQGIKAKEKDNARDLTQTVEDFGRQSNLIFENNRDNLDQQNKSIFDRIRQRKER